MVLTHLCSCSTCQRPHPFLWYDQKSCGIEDHKENCHMPEMPTSLSTWGNLGIQTSDHTLASQKLKSALKVQTFQCSFSEEECVLAILRIPKKDITLNCKTIKFYELTSVFSLLHICTWSLFNTDFSLLQSEMKSRFWTKACNGLESLPCTHLTQIRSSALLMVLWIPPEMITECRIRNKLQTLLGVSPTL